jgi:Membrane bound FAD containing D-sorbitol dehydrogenase
MATLTRRALLASAVLLAPAAHLRAFAPRPLATAPTSLDEFVELSQRLLGRSKLDRAIARTYLDAVLSNADDAIQLAYLVESNANPTPEMRALASTIIEWWYTGVYTINGTSRLATHSGALMWSALGTPAPGSCAGAFGAWSRPPETIA